MKKKAKKREGVKLTGEPGAMRLVLRSKPYRNYCMVDHCGRRRPSLKRKKSGGICSRCLMLRWRANNPEHASFTHLRGSAAKRGISFELTFQEFKKWGHENGYFNGKGRTSGCLTVDRKEKHGPYAIWNMQVLTVNQNSAKERARQLGYDWELPDPDWTEQDWTDQQPDTNTPF